MRRKHGGRGKGTAGPGGGGGWPHRPGQTSSHLRQEERVMETRDQRPSPETLAAQASLNGGGPPREEGTYCARCGIELDTTGIAAQRFGEAFCSEPHADAFVSEVRAARAETAALAVRSGEGGGSRTGVETAEPESPASTRWDLKRVLKMAACCGAPILVLVFLAGGGGALLGAGAAILPVLALLACPIGMFFMMRAMGSHGKSDSDGGKHSASGSGNKKEQ